MSRHGGKYYRLMLAALDELGITITIHRVQRKWYEVHQNFEAVKRYKKRDSCNKYIKRQYKKNVHPPTLLYEQE